MKFSQIIVSFTVLAASTLALPQEVPTSGCDAKACATEVVKLVGKTAGKSDFSINSLFKTLTGTAGCVLEGTAKGIAGQAGGVICNNMKHDVEICKNCKTDELCDLNDQKARGKACGPGNLAQLGLGRCIQLKSSVPNPDPNTDIVDGDYVIHCANAPKENPSGTTTNGGTCTWDCSQCDQCIAAGKNNEVIKP